MTFPGLISKSGVRAVSEVARACWPMGLDEGCYDRLLKQIGEARVVLIGEASHGTHEFYRERARLTQRLIEEKGFRAVAVEADWPDAYRVNRWVRGQGSDVCVEDALSEFRRFPAWMWRNRDVVDFAVWLRQWNSGQETKIGFYGLDLYSLHSSAQAVLRYLDRTDKEAAARARYRYSCFEDFGEDTQGYGYAAAFGMTNSCENAAVEQVREIHRRTMEFTRDQGEAEREEIFSAHQNARLVRDAEVYYRTMFGGRVDSWNVRDRHMSDTLGCISDFLGAGEKIVVWAHNSHLGDARATAMGRMGELNVGQLVRERWGSESFLIGFTTYCGEVTAANNWDEPAERKVVNRALDGSYEALFHQVGIADFVLPLRDEGVRRALAGPMLERAIGVIYRPKTERLSHYFESNLPEQFDAVIHLDRTRAVIPLEKSVPSEAVELPETYPTAV